MMIDWSGELEAFDTDGRVKPAIKEEASRVVWVDGKPWNAFFNGSTDGPWSIRNLPEHPTPTQYAPELVERMVALCRMIAGPPLAQGNIVGLATAIVSDLSQEVDPDLLEARRIAAEWDLPIRKGERDTSEVQAVWEAIVRGREIERGAAA
jgi:hypothetical protein